MLVLDALQDDIEQIPSIMRMLGEWRPVLRAEYTEVDVIEALRSLLERKLVNAYEESVERPELVPVDAPDPRAMHDFWFDPTAAGRAAWEKWAESVDRAGH